MEINIYGNKVAFISYRQEELLGVLIESAEIAKTMRSVFGLVWDGLPVEVGEKSMYDMRA